MTERNRCRGGRKKKRIPCRHALLGHVEPLGCETLNVMRNGWLDSICICVTSVTPHWLWNIGLHNRRKKSAITGSLQVPPSGPPPDSWWLCILDVNIIILFREEWMVFVRKLLNPFRTSEEERHRSEEMRWVYPFLHSRCLLYICWISHRQYLIRSSL